MIVNKKILAAAILAVNFTSLPNAFSTNDKMASPGPMVAPNLSKIVMVCPSSMNVDQFKMLDKESKITLKVRMNNRFKDMEFYRVNSQPIWNADYQPYQKFIDTNTEIAKHYVNLAFSRAVIDVKASPAVIKCLYDYSIPKSDPGSPANVQTVTTRSIGVMYNNPR